jgi:hypothetical protein
MVIASSRSEVFSLLDVATSSPARICLRSLALKGSAAHAFGARVGTDGRGGGEQDARDSETQQGAPRLDTYEHIFLLSVQIVEQTFLRLGHPIRAFYIAIVPDW